MGKVNKPSSRHWPEMAHHVRNEIDDSHVIRFRQIAGLACQRVLLHRANNNRFGTILLESAIDGRMHRAVLPRLEVARDKWPFALL
ncbi:hypothetical protein ATI53_10354 [Salipiger aestuarii]|uniref:Uncharacterized protein n=1 Tax=Salipiger aestuarii TaxID=568098 RepID=A0A327Y0X6_9RHOB|nr:hypothetical protein ATI53_10354 [Salipiger aestuarii]